MRPEACILCAANTHSLIPSMPHISTQQICLPPAPASPQYQHFLPCPVQWGKNSSSSLIRTLGIPAFRSRLDILNCLRLHILGILLVLIQRMRCCVTTDTSQANVPICSLDEKAETPAIASPVSLSSWRWPMAKRDVISCGWKLLTSSLAVGLRVSHTPSCPEIYRKALVKCLLIGCVVMATTWDQAREKLAPTVHWL